MIRDEAALMLARNLISILAPQENSSVSMPGLVAKVIQLAVHADEQRQANDSVLKSVIRGDVMREKA